LKSKECPSCKQEPKAEKVPYENSTSPFYYYCSGCDLRTSGSSFSEAAEKWNNRKFDSLPGESWYRIPVEIKATGNQVFQVKGSSKREALKSFLRGEGIVIEESLKDIELLKEGISEKDVEVVRWKI
jgi:hypothetical protein